MGEKLEIYKGCMASGKSNAIIERANELEANGLTIACIKPDFEVRDNGIESRNSARRDAIPVESLGKAALIDAVDEADAVVVDELFFFNGDLLEDSIDTINSWLERKRHIVAATLDYSAMGRLMTVYEAVVGSFDPVLIDCTEAECRDHDNPVQATRTQIIEKSTGAIIRDGLPELVPEDPKHPIYTYKPVCVDCFGTQA
jgi:thymidine kinase